MRGQHSLLSDHSPNLFFCFKGLTFVVPHTSPRVCLTTNGLELTVDDTRALHMLRRGFKTHFKDHELSSASNAKSGQVDCLPPCCARVSQSLGAHMTVVLLLPYACNDLV